jgi:hypothetical protein
MTVRPVCTAMALALVSLLAPAAGAANPTTPGAASAPNPTFENAHRHTPEGYLVVPRAAEHEMVRPEPFDAIEVEVRVLLGGDPA